MNDLASKQHLIANRIYNPNRSFSRILVWFIDDHTVNPLGYPIYGQKIDPGEMRCWNS